MFDAGTLAVIPFPFSDLTATKRRPVLLLTAPDSYGDFIAMAVTSQMGHADNMVILQSMMESGTLPKASFIRTDKIVSLNQSLIVKEVGKVAESLRQQAVRRLCVRLSGVAP
ncbi:MAG: type II toxin-antitoxin system PemK/MazF family toxin [Candidatus Competibacteraceae bacterium]|jgi:mRNA interferase MazF